MKNFLRRPSILWYSELNPDQLDLQKPSLLVSKHLDDNKIS